MGCNVIHSYPFVNTFLLEMTPATLADWNAMDSPKKDKHLVVRVPESYVLELKRAAAEEDLKMADLVRRLVRTWYDQRRTRVGLHVKKSAISEKR